MPFLDNLILGRPGSQRRQRYLEDSSLSASQTTASQTARNQEWSLRPHLDALLSTLGIVTRQHAELAIDDHIFGSPGSGAGGAEEARPCGNLACGTSWIPPWKSRAYPVFEGQWACSRSCLEAMVKTALRRDAGDRAYEDGPEPHPHRIPLGLVMLAQGWITHPQLQSALEAQRAHGSGRIGEWLMSQCGTKPDRIARGLGAQWNCPVLSTEGFWPEAMALVLPRVFLEEYGAVPLRVAGRKILYVGFQDSLDASATLAIELMTGLRVESGVLPQAEFTRAQETLLRCEFPRQSIAAAGDGDGLARAIIETLEHEQPEASRLVRLHRYYWLRVWAKGGECAVADLPAHANGVRDYLFTIGSRVSRSSQRNYKNLQSAGETGNSKIQMPVMGVRRESAGPVESPLESVNAISDRSAAEQPAHIAETASQAADFELEETMEASVELETEAGPQVPPSLDSGAEASQIQIERSPEEAPALHFLARLETFVDGLTRRDDLVLSSENALDDAPSDIYRFTRRPPDYISISEPMDGISEPMDGEYLPVEVALDVVTAAAPEVRSPSWNGFGRTRRLKPSSPDRQTGPALGPGREG